MTDTTQRVYDYIVWFKREYDGLAPSVREICLECGLSSTSTAVYHLRRLVEQGLLRVLGGRLNRGIMVVGGQWGLSTAPELARGQSEENAERA